MCPRWDWLAVSRLFGYPQPPPIFSSTVLGNPRESIWFVKRRSVPCNEETTCMSDETRESLLTREKGEKKNILWLSLLRIGFHRGACSTFMTNLNARQRNATESRAHAKSNRICLRTVLTIRSFLQVETAILFRKDGFARAHNYAPSSQTRRNYIFLAWNKAASAKPVPNWRVSLIATS